MVEVAAPLAVAMEARPQETKVGAEAEETEPTEVRAAVAAGADGAARAKPPENAAVARSEARLMEARRRLRGVAGTGTTR
ncbi:MAG: hypothetical protein AUH30_12145 [Candidatus Rokubacteria bacterium 13_1_40CM_68_15]|nr:MAG: hypothetical protein AUH30_12145 [Candidatus Rokubacteria bacterium 13_1_40CM_68_15]